MTAFRTLDQADVKGKRVLVRVDLNVPMENGRVTDATRIERVLPTIREIADKGGKVDPARPFRPAEGTRPEGVPEAGRGSGLASTSASPVAFAEDCIGEAAAKAVAALKDGDVLLLENTRFHAGEEKNDPAFVKELATLGDLYVNDAFSAAHRAHASTEGLARVLPGLCRPHHAGRARRPDEGPRGARRGPLVAIVGGAKVSTKIDLLENLVAKVDALVIGGGMANTFLHAMGLERRQVARREGSRRDGAAHHREGARDQLRHHPAGRRRLRLRVQGRARTTTPTASTRSPTTR